MVSNPETRHERHDTLQLHEHDVLFIKPVICYECELWCEVYITSFFNVKITYFTDVIITQFLTLYTLLKQKGDSFRIQLQINGRF